MEAYKYKTRWPQDGDNILFQGRATGASKVLHSKKSAKIKKALDALARAELSQELESFLTRQLDAAANHLTPEGQLNLINAANALNSFGTEYFDILHHPLRTTAESAYEDTLDQEAPALLDQQVVAKIDSSFKHINDTTLKMIQSAIESHPGITKEVLREYLFREKILENRADLIADTELLGADAMGSGEAMAQIPGAMKKWVTAKDEKVRHAHQILDGEVVPAYKPFSNGLRYPRDPNGKIEDIINCRCHVKLVKRDEMSKASSLLEKLGNLEKALSGEGSRGGKIIGHTKTGKPIYENADHPEHKDFTSKEHQDAADLHAKRAEAASGEYQSALHSGMAKETAKKEKTFREKLAQRHELTEDKSPKGVHPGVDSHNIQVAPKEKTYVPPEGFTGKGGSMDEPELKAYKFLAKEMLQAGHPVTGHITYDQKTRKIRALTPQGEAAMHEIAAKHAHATAAKHAAEGEKKSMQVETGAGGGTPSFG
jgi:hypothetical protein